MAIGRNFAQSTRCGWTKVLAMSTGRELAVIPDADVLAPHFVSGSEGAGDQDLHFLAMTRLLTDTRYSENIVL